VKTEVKQIMAEHNFSSFKDEGIPLAALERISEILNG